MKWIAYSLAIFVIASGTLVASSTVATAEPESSQAEPTSQPQDEDFIPTEKVPADSAISFPVDI